MNQDPVQTPLSMYQLQAAGLFGKAKGNVSKHIKHNFEGKELEESSVVRLFRTTAADGKQYEVAHYYYLTLVTQPSPREL